MARLKLLIEDLRKNKNWIFSGIGIYVIGGFIGLLTTAFGFIFHSKISPKLNAIWIHFISPSAVPHWLLYLLAALSILTIWRFIEHLFNKYERSQILPILEEKALQCRDADFGTLIDVTGAKMAFEVLKRDRDGSPIKALIKVWESTQALDLFHGRGKRDYISMAFGLIGKRAKKAVPKIEEDLDKIDPVHSKYLWDLHLDTLKKIDTGKARKVLIKARERER
jgi:hypothetical protein